jgi:hypothetical protein
LIRPAVNSDFMKSSPELFQLVKSLSKNEKRYVTLYLASGLMGSYSSSIALFKAIARQKVHDDEALKKMLSPSVTKRFAAEKNKLFELILESMRLFYNNSTTDRELISARYNAIFLLQRRLYSSAWKQLTKMDKLAEETDVAYFSLMSGFLRSYAYSNTSITSTGYEYNYEKEVAHALSNIEILRTEVELYYLNTEVQRVDRFFTGAKEREERLNELSKHPLLDLAAPLHSFFSKITRLEIISHISTLLGDFELSMKTSLLRVELYLSDPACLKRDLGRFCTALGNYIAQAIYIGRYDVYKERRDEYADYIMRTKSYQSGNTEYLHFISIGFIDLSYAVYSEDLPFIKGLMPGLEKSFAIYRDQMRRDVFAYILYYLSVCYFLTGDEKRALRYINDFLDSVADEENVMFCTYARLLRMMLLSKPGNEETVNGLARSAVRFMKMHKCAGEGELKLSNILETYPASEKAWKELWKYSHILPDKQLRSKESAVLHLGMWIERQTKLLGISLR